MTAVPVDEGASSVLSVAATRTILGRIQAMFGGRLPAPAELLALDPAKLRKAVQAAYGLDHRPSEAEVLAIAEKWRPYRSLATSYLFSAVFAPAAASAVKNASA
jgi:3-methyladenine DNA glycosylase/8-oxoguanine DNA glycosylase